MVTARIPLVTLTGGGAALGQIRRDAAAWLLKPRLVPAVLLGQTATGTPSRTKNMADGGKAGMEVFKVAARCHGTTVFLHVACATCPRSPA